MVPVSDICAAVESVLGAGLLRRRCRDRRCVVARWMVMHLARRAGHSYGAIARSLVVADHTTVLHGCREFAKVVDVYAVELAAVEKRLSDVKERGMATENRPTPFVLWEQAKGNRDEYIRLMELHGWIKNAPGEAVSVTHIEKWNGPAKHSVCGESGPTALGAMQSNCDKCRELVGIAPVGEVGARLVAQPPPQVREPGADEVLDVLRQLSREGAAEHDTVGRRMSEAFDRLDLLASEKRQLPAPWRHS